MLSFSFNFQYIPVQLQGMLTLALHCPLIRKTRSSSSYALTRAEQACLVGKLGRGAARELLQLLIAAKLEHPVGLVAKLVLHLGDGNVPFCITEHTSCQAQDRLLTGICCPPNRKQELVPSCFE